MQHFPQPAFINAIGTAVPAFKVSQQQQLKILASSNGYDRSYLLRLRKIYNSSGIDSRYSVVEEFGKEDHPGNIIFHPANHTPEALISRRMEMFEKYAPELCVKAVHNCLEKLQDFPLKSITHLISFSCTGMSAPGIDIQLIEKLGLNRNVERTCINFMGCYAGINALKIAHHIIRSVPDAVVLLTGIELCTLHYRQKELNDQLIANALFADGAVACIVTGDRNKTNRETPVLKLNSFYAEFEPSGKDEMVWRIGEDGFDLRLSIYVPNLIKTYIRKLMDKLFERANITQGEIDFYAIHPGGTKILEACEQALGIDKIQNQISYKVLREYGNMSSVTIFFVLKLYLDTLHTTDRGKKLLACAFGPGLTMESMLAEIQ